MTEAAAKFVISNEGDVQNLAMNNVSSKERCCIEKSHQARLAAAQDRLLVLEKKAIPFDGPGLSLADGIEWKENVISTIVQIALLPLILLLDLVAISITLITCVLHSWKSHNYKQMLKREIKALETESLSDQVPDKKDLESLWMLHGLEKSKYSSNERLCLIETWIVILYGTDETKNINLKQKANEISKRQMKANLHWYEDKGAAHFLFSSPVDSLIRQLSEELTPYQSA